ncbi:hypothetical protein [Streptosporangium sp. 'caverna']|uniref:hypothetical protein n=1 Tax=Streptosporangium sp. 'caverna' TaxID=2202249 RepID=UPI000D7DD647|nr:hypothetical protein [Streptosporangium sp. 'caverna']AWS46992.1 hypothetical protein DKM19_42530 [Streptosporangium sp. 'caverna']
MKLLYVIGAALAVIAICAAAVLISRPVSESPPVPVACPQRWDSTTIGGWVPAAADLDGIEESLVPGEPAEAMICAYPGDNAHPGGERLAGSRTLTGETKAMARDLAYLPVSTEAHGGPCTAMGGPMTNYLIRFAYPGGEALWVGSAEEVNSCVRTTNGTADSRSYIGPSLTTAYRTGTWKLSRPDDPCTGRTTGRRGQDERMVPEGPVSVLVCGEIASSDKRSPRLEHGRQVATALAETLNSPDTRPSENICHQIAGVDDRTLRLLFAYADGPPADVQISMGCKPGINNGLLQADLDDPVRDEVTRLAPPKDGGAVPGE